MSFRGASELAQEAVHAATLAKLSVATAESLTGGLLAAALVEVPGASAVLTGGIVAYHTALKRTLLGVDATLLTERGPVDAEVARQLARGARFTCAVPDGEGREPSGNARPADVGVSTTGVAGPGSDPQTGQPPGTVWVGVSSALGDRAVELRLTEDRPRIRTETVRVALQELVVELSGLRSRLPLR